MAGPKQRFLIFNDMIIKAPTTQNEKSQSFREVYDNHDISIMIIKPPRCTENTVSHIRARQIGRLIQRLYTPTVHDTFLKMCRKAPYLLTRR